MARLLEHIVNTTGSLLNRYTLKHPDNTTEDVILTFKPGDDTVMGTAFNETDINPMIDAVNDALEIITATLPQGSTSITIANDRITTDSIFSFYTSIYGVNPNEVSVSDGAIVLTFDAQEQDIVVGVKIEGTYGG